MVKRRVCCASKNLCFLKSSGQYLFLHKSTTYLSPLIKAPPAVGIRSPVNILKLVVFPAPFSPKSPKHYN